MKPIFSKALALTLALLFLFSPLATAVLAADSPVVCLNHKYTDDNDAFCNTCNYCRGEKGRTGDCTWVLYNGNLVISGSGEMEDYGFDNPALW